ncbi:MAG: CBS domain-containing protein [Gammaproteobacteria bacterium]|nr:CBS domain-containing protein [Gammaproteobacteria bacterium]
MSTLSLTTLAAPDLPIPGADPWSARAQDPAITVMTDFRERASVTVRESDTIDAALDHMKHNGVRCAFVTNAAERVVGLITAYDIMGEKPLRHAQAPGAPQHDIAVKDIAVKISEWQVVDVRELERTTVDAVRRTLDRSQLTHLPVMETTGSGPRLRGLLSAAKIRRLLANAADLHHDRLPAQRRSSV